MPATSCNSSSTLVWEAELEGRGDPGLETMFNMSKNKKEKCVQRLSSGLMMPLIYRRIPSFLLHEPRKELGLKLPRKNKQWWHSPLFSGHVGHIGFPHNPFFHVKHRSRLKATWPCCHMCDSGTLYLTSSFYLFIGAPSFHTAVFVYSAAHSSTTADCVDTPTCFTPASGKPRLFPRNFPRWWAWTTCA